MGKLSRRASGFIPAPPASRPKIISTDSSTVGNPAVTKVTKAGYIAIELIQRYLAALRRTSIGILLNETHTLTNFVHESSKVCLEASKLGTVDRGVKNSGR